MKSLYVLEIGEPIEGSNLNFEFKDNLHYLREFCTDLDFISGEKLNENNFNSLKKKFTLKLQAID